MKIIFITLVILSTLHHLLGLTGLTYSFNKRAVQELAADSVSRTTDFYSTIYLIAAFGNLLFIIINLLSFDINLFFCGILMIGAMIISSNSSPRDKEGYFKYSIGIAVYHILCLFAVYSSYNLQNLY